MRSQILHISVQNQSVQAQLINTHGKITATAIQSFQESPQSHMYNPFEIIYAIRSTINTVSKCSDTSLSAIKGLALICSPQITVIWDRLSGQTLSPAIHADFTQNESDAKLMSQNTIIQNIETHSGLSFSAQHPALKWKWLCKSNPHLKHNKSICVGTLDSWILYHLTGRSHIVTDISQASQTLLLNIHTLNWDPFLLDLFELDAEMLPKITTPCDPILLSKGFVPLPDNIPILANTTPLNATLFGQNALDMGHGYLDYDRISTISLSTGSQVQSKTQAGILPIYEGSKQSYHCYQHGWAPKEAAHLTPYNESLHQLNNGPYVIPLSPSKFYKHIPEKYQLNIMKASSSEQAHLESALLPGLCHSIKKMINQIESEQQMSFKTISVPAKLPAHLCQYLSDILQLSIQRYQESNAQTPGLIQIISKSHDFFKQSVTLKKLNPIQETYIPAIDPISSYSMHKQWSTYDMLINPTNIPAL